MKTNEKQDKQVTTEPVSAKDTKIDEIVATESVSDDEMVQAAFQHLLDTYLASPHRKKTAIITKAFNFAKQAHKGVRRLSGEPYIMHPLAVAQIACGEIGLGSTSICAALLHDVVEDTDYTVEDLANVFGDKVAQIVDGLTKISGGIFGERASGQAENFKKLLLTMSDDIRVILIKISDRLHNMRTLGSQPAHKQYKIAGETLYIYAPLAHRLGLNLIKEELEDLSFRYEHPEQHDMLAKKIDDLRPRLDLIFQDFVKPLRKHLDELGYKYELKSRIKRPYSVWMKMQNKHVSFDEIYDLLAARIIFEPKKETSETSDCMIIYDACLQIYKERPGRLRNWLHQGKANGYRALHTTLMREDGQWIEVQIRSRQMDAVAEHGFAAHWKYKEGDIDPDANDAELDRWLLTIKEILDDPQPADMDFLDTIKLNLYSQEILVVTPKGEFRTMPAGCTVLDFAFSVHTFMGAHCMGAKVNHVLVPFSYVLQSGDQVEILTSNTQRVEEKWLASCTTAKAKNKVEAILRRQKRELQKKGEEQVMKWFDDHELEQSSVFLDRLCIMYNMQRREDLYAAIGEGKLMLTDEDAETVLHRTNEIQKRRKTWRRFVPFMKEKAMPEVAVGQPTDENLPQQPVQIDRKKPIILNAANISRFIMCPHCRPIAGDDVLGHFDENNRVTIHKRECPIADKLKTSDGNHILAAKWETKKDILFGATLHIEGLDRVGILRSLTDVLTQQLNVNVRRLTIDTHDNIFQGDIELSVHDTEDTDIIIKNLQDIEGLEEVIRVG